MHLWEKYLFNPQADYLERVAYPVMKSAFVSFDWVSLVKDKDGSLVAPDECSPEHESWEDGVAYAPAVD